MTPSKPLRDNHARDALSAGETALEESRYQEASEHFKRALRMGAPAPEHEAHLRCLLSESFERRGLYREALDAVGKYEKMPEFVRLSDRAQMSILIRLGWSYIFLSNIPRSIAFFNQAMTVAQQLNDDAGSGACCFGLGRAYRGLNELAIARDQYETGLDHYRRLGDWRRLAESYIFIGQISAHEGDYRGSLYSLKQALAIIGDHDEQNLSGRVYTYLAVFYDHQGQTGKALASWERAIEHFRISNNQPLLALNYNNLADKLVYLGEWARAEELLKAAIEIAKETLGVTTVGGSLDTLAQLFLLRGQIGEADRLLEESLQVLLSIKSGEWAEVSTLITIGRSHLMKQQVDQAEEVLSRAVEMCERSGDNQYLSEARLWLSDACLRQGDISRASSLVETVRSYLVEAAHIKWWGLMMRMAAKIEASKGHIAAAIQSLGQSTSIFEIRGSVYDVAVNRVALAEMLERQNQIAAATREIEMALEVFQRLGAASDEQNARSRLAALKRALVTQIQASTIGDDSSRALPASFQAGPDLVSMIDGFTTRRLVQAAVFRDLLLHELASIIREQANSRAALVAEVDGDRLKLSTSVGLDKNEKAEAIRFLGTLLPEERGKHFVYPFNDRRRTNYLLYVIAPRSERFVTGTISLEPLLDLVKLSLEVESQRSKSRRPQVFDPARLLSQVALPGFICASRAISLVLEQIHKIRSSDVTVLITGESGSGKELIARAVHASSSRRFNTFLPFNCSAAPRDMIESQLFGHKKGAFTGAIANNEGLARAAERGTLFLDEIGDLPLELQPKLLRFLQEGEVHPIGESKPQKVDVRVVAATNSELERAVSEGRFREDLFHRLNVIRIHVPPLRQRREEIPALINYYLTLYQKEAAKSGIMLSEEAMDLLVVYDWPGNVRQLCNEVRRIVAYSESGAIVTEEALSEEIVKATRELEAASTVGTKKGSEPQAPLSAGRTLADAINEVERQMIQDALRRSSGNIARAAKELGLTRRGLYMKMDRLHFKA
ncbi:MAG: sigma 54-interacting transcriptional regulator [Acidobacteriota bacterium]